MTSSTDSPVFYTNSLYWLKETPFMQSSVDDFIKRLAASKPTYEALTSDIRSLYFDIDVYTPKIKKQDAQIIEEQGLKILTECLKEAGHEGHEITVATSHGQALKDKKPVNKYSVRFWVQTIKAHFLVNKKFVEMMNDYVRTSYESKHMSDDHIFEYVGELFEEVKDGKTTFGDLFDTSIYDTNRKMRCIGTSKDGESRPLVLKKGDLKSTLISNLSQATATLVGKTPEENGVKITSANEHIQKYCDYMNIINKSHFDSYENWFKIQRASANLLIPFDVYDGLMKGCQGYNRENNRKAYETPEDNKRGKLGWKHIFDLAFAHNPEKKVELDLKFGRSTFCKYKFQSILKNYDESTDDDKQTKKQEVVRRATEYFEKYHFKVMTPYCFGRKTENGYDFISKETLHNIYENLFMFEKPFTKKWVADFKIREYETYDFCPPPFYISDSTFNLFNGFVHEKILPFEITDEEIASNSQPFIKHLWYLSGKNNEVLEYILDYLAQMVQEPADLPRTAIVFKSEQGVGKNLFFESFAEKILGDEYLLSTPNIDHILGRFPLINQKILVLMDEANGKDSFLANDKIKNFITAKHINYEKKGIDGVNIKNCSRMMFFTNNDFPVKIEQTDRRFVVVECASDVKNNTPYFKALLEAFNDKKRVWSFAQFLLRRNIAEWDSVNDRPITKIYKEVQTATIPSDTRFFVDYHHFAYGTQQEAYTGKDLYNLYTTYCRSQPKQYVPITEMTFLKRLKDYTFLKKTKTRDTRNYEIDQAEHQKFISDKTLADADDEEHTDSFAY